MLFNSIDFAIFLPLVFAIYWLLQKRGLATQNLFIVCSSYVFYGWWDWRFLGLIFFSTLVDYVVSLGLNKANNPLLRKGLLFTSIGVNLGFLGFFKYYNAFVENFSSAFTFFGRDINIQTMYIILPVGISFYTFQTMSYTFDVYRKKMEPTKNFIAFAAYVSFFPQLVAGPIERATRLLPQFFVQRTFDYTQAMDGMRQILWGLFKKMVIADNCAIYANLFFEHTSDFSGSTLLLGTLFFSFQIYGDFSGYSDIAIGTSRLFGFNLMRNFNYPYFARDIAEFWRRWHISLTTWFRDYLYIPLGGSRGPLHKTIRNTLIVFVVSGLWHGANLTFIFWGLLNALLFIPLLLRGTHRKNLDMPAIQKPYPSIAYLWAMLSTFVITSMGWVLFRAESLTHAFSYYSGIFSKSLFTLPQFPGINRAATLLFLITIFIILEWRGRFRPYAIHNFASNHKPLVRLALYYVLVFVILWFGGEEQQFIYFQF
jgi:alginate O-acetyltransferase complex protein AlgI